MNLSAPFIKRPVMTTLLASASLTFGVLAYFQLPVSDLPNIDFPIISVSAVYPGASPTTMATTVATPLEKELLQIEGVTELKSTSLQSSTSITIQFSPSRSVNEAAQDVQAAISRAQSNLPSDLPEPPTYSKINTGSMPIMYLTLTSHILTEGQLYDYGNGEIAQTLSTLDGVGQVSVYGNKSAYRIKVDPISIENLGIDLSTVSSAITSGTTTIPAGSINGNTLNFLLDGNAQLLSKEAFENLIVTYKDGAPVRLRNIASVEHSVSSPDQVMNVIANGKGFDGAAVVLAVFRSPGKNTVEIAEEVKSRLPDISEDLPADLELSIMYNKADTIIESINDVKTTLLIAFILVVAVVFLFLGRIADTVIPAVAIPFSLLLCIIGMHGFNFSLDNISLMALTLAVGFVVDDAIVVLENTVRRMEQFGESPLRAAINGSQEIAFTIISMTISLAAIFVPLAFMPGILGLMFNEFAVTIMLTIFTSSIVAITISPMMCARMLAARGKDRKPSAMEQAANRVLVPLTDLNTSIIRWMVRRKWLVCLIWVLLLGGTILLLAIVPKAMLPDGDSGSISGSLITRQGASTDEIRRLQTEVLQVFDNNSAVTSGILYSGSGQSNGMIFIDLVKRSERPGMSDVVKDLRDKLAPLQSGSVSLNPVPVISLGGGGGGGTGSISYSLRAPQQDILYEWARKFTEKLETLPQVQDVDSSLKLATPSIQFDIHRDRASSLNVTARSIEQTLSLGFGGGRLTTIKTPVDQYDVVLELDDAYRKSFESLSSLKVASSDGNLVPLDEVASWEITAGTQSVEHLQQQPAVTISCNPGEGYSASDAQNAISTLADQMLPKVIDHEFPGQAGQDIEKTIVSLVVLLAVAILVMYLVLGILYESYVHPITVLSSLPVAAFGGLFSLLVTGSELSLFAFIGMFMLLGIVKKNGIMIVDFANDIRKTRDVSPEEAAVEASHQRFRPILMTTLSAVVGALPIALGFGADGSSRQPLGIVVVGGLILAQLVTLYVSPVVYVIMDKLEVHYLERIPFFRKYKGEEEAPAEA